MSQTPDRVSIDSRLAGLFFAIGAVLIVLGAMAGLNSWPLQLEVEAALGDDPLYLYAVLYGYSAVIVVMYWSARPSVVSQRIVLAAWLVLALVFEQAWGDKLKISWLSSDGFPASLFLESMLAMPCLAAIIWRTGRRPPPGADMAFERRLRWLAALTLLFLIVPRSALQLTAVLHPTTLDVFAAHWDRAAGLVIAPALTHWVDAVPGLPQAVILAYNMTPLAFLSVALLQLRGKPDHVPSTVLVWVVMMSLALLAYHAFPITGPKYAFGEDSFLHTLSVARLPDLGPVGVGAYPRNGMPSMHFGWCLAATILWAQTAPRRWSVAVLIAVTLLTATGTIYLGEHYVVDLIVAVPFVLASMALANTGVRWSARWPVICAGIGAWLVWIVTLRFAMPAYIDRPWLCWLMVLATLLVAGAQWRAIMKFPAAVRLPNLDISRLPDNPNSEQSAYRRKFGAMFFLSGMAALVYQVLFAKELALVFGSTATATFTVLATFLGGMAIGSLIGGRLTRSVPSPLRYYAYVELGIAVYCVITPLLFRWVQAGYVHLASGMPPDAPGLLALRVVLGALVLLVPTVLMGTTLPLLAQAIGPAAGRMGSRVALLYFANTAGAAIGALLTAYMVIPLLGVQRTTFIAALLNLLVALGALELAKSTTGAATPRPEADAAPPGPDSPRLQSKRAQAAAMLSLGLGGVLSLGLEVVYVHMLSIVAGNSTYAFGLMVATFLTGLSLGGEGARRLLLHPRLESAKLLIWMLLGLSAAVALGGLTWNGIPDYFAGYSGYSEARTFGAREAIRGLVCALVMIPPALFIGGAYVVAMDMVTSTADGSDAKAVGTAAFFNTLGNIAGVLVFGFVVLPWLGGLQSGMLIAGAALALAMMVWAMAMPGRWALLGGPAVVAAILALGAQSRLDYGALSSGANVYFFAQNWGQVIDHAESIDGGLTTVTTAGEGTGQVRTLLTNGKFQGNDSIEGEMQAQVGFALAPLLHQSQRDRALVIGYGTGVTTRVFSEAGFRQVDVAELSRDIVRLADRHFGKVNLTASAAPNVAMHITDGRNLLLLSTHRYDVISLEISSIWFAGAASLYNQEFYRLARARLKDDGVLQQWVQLHRLTPQDLLHVVGTLRAEFRHVSLYIMGSQGILVATNTARRADPSLPAMQAMRGTAALNEPLRIVGRSLEELASDRVLDAKGVDRFLVAVGQDPRRWVSTDNNLRLEYDTPRANVNDPTKSMARNKAMFEKFR